MLTRRSLLSQLDKEKAIASFTNPKKRITSNRVHLANYSVRELLNLDLFNNLLG